MCKFLKPQRKKRIEIMGETYEVDFGRDDILFIIQDVAEKIGRAEGNLISGLSSKKSYEAALEVQKAIFKTGINNILDSLTAADNIFKEDNGAVFHSDVYAFLVREYQNAVEEDSPYSPKRLKL